MKPGKWSFLRVAAAWGQLIGGILPDTGLDCTIPSKADAAPPVTPSVTPLLRPVPSSAALLQAIPALVEDPIRKSPPLNHQIDRLR